MNGHTMTKASFLMGLILALICAPWVNFSALAQTPADGEWEEYGTPLTTVLPTQAELGATLWSQIKGQGAGALLGQWTSAMFDPGRREICTTGGGHADYGGNEVYCWNVDTGAVARVTPVLPLTVTEPGYNQLWPEYGPPAQHTYDGFVFMSECLALKTGTPGFAKFGYMTPGSTAHLFNRCTDPWTWTRRDDLRPYVRSMTGLYGNVLVLHGSAGSILLDATTGAVLAPAVTNKGVKMNGSAMAVAGYTSLFSAGGVSSTGYFCAATGNIWLHCSNVNGSIRDIDGNGVLDDDTFGRFRRIPIGAGVGADPIAAQLFGYHSMATMPDGWFALWNGGRKIIFFRPSPDNLAAGDQWAVVEPLTGPTDGTNALTYDKIFWDDQTCTLVGVSNRDEGLWRYNPAFVADCTEPEVTAAPDTGPWGPDPDASLASLALRSDTLLADPLDDTPIQGPGIKPTDDCLTMTEASDPWVCSPYNWRSNYLDRGGDPNNQAQIDTTVAVEGGSLRFTQESGSGPGDGGKYEVNPSKDGSVGVSVGNWVRLRYKVRYNCDYFYLDCDPQSPGYKTARRVFPVVKGHGGFKMGQLAEVHRADGNGGSIFIDTAGVNTAVFANYKQTGFPGAYIWGWNRTIQARFPKIQGITNWDIQPGGPTTCLLYDPNNPVLTPWRDPGCYTLKADEWMTVQEDLYYGPCASISNSTLQSHLRLWIADEGQPFQLVMDTPIDLGCADIAEPGPMLGRMGFTTFMTGLEPSVHPDAIAWLDNAWVARIEAPAP
jgi:hypothetical protein